MSFRNLAIAIVAITSLSACSSNNEKQTFAPNAAEQGSTSENAPYEVATPVYTYNVDGSQLRIDGADIDRVEDSTFEGYPALAAHTKAIGTVDKVIETNANSIELYAGNELLMAIDSRADTNKVLFSKDASFKAEKVSYNRMAAEQGQDATKGEVMFELNECKVAEEKKEEQGQEEQKQEDKTEEQQQKQGLMALVGAEEQGQGKQEEQKQEDKVDQEKGPECKAVTVKLNLSQVVVEEKQEEQNQGKQEEQGQGKQEEQGQGKQEEQGQGKVEEEKQQEEKKQEEQKREDKVDESKQEQEQAQGQGK